ncbi:MAG TPA: hypothetical protein VD998_04355 [Verrucomicrobiae bacterium]|nr:hypothetical protein [Verrucomicrobiae bacterium]
MRFIWGLVTIGVGFILIKYTFGLVQTFGKITWAEIHLSGGMGGTYTLYKIVGVVVIFLGFMYMFGGVDFLVKPLTPLFGNAPR